MWFDPGLAGLFITSTLLHLGEDINLLVVSPFIRKFKGIYEVKMRTNKFSFKIHNVGTFSLHFNVHEIGNEFRRIEELEKFEINMF